MKCSDSSMFTTSSVRFGSAAAPAFYEVVAARASLDVDGGHCHLREGEE